MAGRPAWDELINQAWILSSISNSPFGWPVGLGRISLSRAAAQSPYGPFRGRLAWEEFLLPERLLKVRAVAQSPSAGAQIAAQDNA